ncbi:MAG: bifunctional serine/threonine-protein kinase/formylglycine-generating enzyme family protein [bacterium]
MADDRRDTTLTLAPGSLPPVGASARIATLLPARYSDRGLIGTGGMGEVRRVHDRVLARSVAMKVMRLELSAREAARARFIREAQVTAGLQHPGIVAVHDQGELPDGRLWYTMQEVRGETLEAMLPDTPLRRRVEVLARVAQAVGFAHRASIIHRDLKPSNIMVGTFGEVLVLDWGLARVVASPDTSPPPAAPPVIEEGHDALTRLGHAIGTPAYMSPEQAAGASVGPTTDVYALGAILAEVLVVEEAPRELAEIQRRALAVEPEDRYPDAVSFAEALLAWLDGARRRAEAHAILGQARALLAPLAEARAQAASLARRAETILAPLPPHAPISEKLPGWRLQRAARERAHAVRLLEIELVQKARSALERSEDLGEAHDLLAGQYRERLAEAEKRRDPDATAEFLALLRAHDRGQHTAWIAGHGRLTLHTEPAGAEVTIWHVVEEDRRLVAHDPRALGPAPVEGLELAPGGYALHLAVADRPPVILPIRIERHRDWHAGPLADPDRAVQLPAGWAADEAYVPGGWTLCGGDDRAPDSLPRRRIWLAGFFARRFPVTVAEYLDFLNDLMTLGCLGEAGLHAPGEESGVALDAAGRFTAEASRLDSPVVDVTWWAATRYAAWLAARTGLPWRLPHELEWERAARGGDGRFFPWGDDFEPVWTRALHSTAGPPVRASVHAFPEDESPWGIRGLAGNVRDWCANAFLRVPPDDDAAVQGGDDAPTPGDRDGYVAVRGGSYTSIPDFCRSAARFGARPGDRRGAVGFRLVRQATGQSAPS